MELVAGWLPATYAGTGLSCGPHDNLELGRLGISLDGKAGGWGFSGNVIVYASC